MNVKKFNSDSSKDDSTNKEIVLLGEIVSVFGIKGYCKVNSYTDPKANIVEYFNSGIPLLWRSKKPVTNFHLSSEWSEIPLEDIKAQSDSKIIAKIENCNDRDLALQFRGAQIAITREDLSKFEIDDTEFYWHDLEGLNVFDKEGTLLGVVSHLLATGANDVLVVKNTDTQKEHLIPFVYNEYVLEVDLESNKLIVDWDISL